MSLNYLLPLGENFDEAIDLISNSEFTEFYTGIKNPLLNNCSISHHYSPKGAFDRHQIKQLFEKAKEKNKIINITFNVQWITESIKDILIEDIKFISQFNNFYIVVANLQVYDLIKMINPNLLCSASSLFGIKSCEGTEFFINKGFSRVILPRNIELKAIKEIATKYSNKIDIEVFIYGGGCNFCEGTCHLPHIYLGEIQHDIKFDISTKSPLPICKLPMQIRTNGEIYKNFTSIHQGAKNCGFCYVKIFSEWGIKYFKFTGRTMNQDKRKNVISKFNIRSELTPATCICNADECLYGKEMI